MNNEEPSTIGSRVLSWALLIDLAYALFGATIAASGNLSVDTLSDAGRAVIDSDTVITWLAAFVVCFVQGGAVMVAAGFIVLIIAAFFPCQKES